jgi:hypothetical protein
VATTSWAILASTYHRDRYVYPIPLRANVFRRELSLDALSGTPLA